MSRGTTALRLHSKNAEASWLGRARRGLEAGWLDEKLLTTDARTIGYLFMLDRLIEPNYCNWPAPVLTPEEVSRHAERTAGHAAQAAAHKAAQSAPAAKAN